ncbi:MAG: S-methyl-5-thioribose-1-phosphate isomerase [Deltaproteobacteria bacterium]|nr:MAG: S-methyl-5-thioribose-1-phosphate isomerase [Deltaproteobacteria bacterium]
MSGVEGRVTEGAEPVRAVAWVGDAATGCLQLLDQRLLPGEEVMVRCRTAGAAADAIRSMVVRGAPAIGVAAAYGLVLAGQEVGGPIRAVDLEPSAALLGEARPTAVNLRWALERVLGRVRECAGEVDVDVLLREAEAIRKEDLDANLRMGDAGARLLPAGGTVLTICNTGSLATAGYGTALGVVRSAWRDGRITGVIACETRPYLQGARLTMWELARDGIPVSLATDGMAGHLMRTGQVSAVVVGADRIAANGDTANKIGTYGLAVLARHHGLPFHVVAPWSTVDPRTSTGEDIPIEERSADEVLELAGVRIAPEGARALHPAFDVTPAELITSIVTELGVARPPFSGSLRDLGGGA